MTRPPSLRPPMLAWLVLASLVWLALPRPARAQTAAELERAKESFKAGAAAYAAGDYLASIQALDAAYALTPAPAIAFSLAQAERRQYFVGHQREHLDRAISLFRRYLEQVASGGRRADALDALSQLEPLAAVQAGAGGGQTGAAPATEAGKRATRVMITSEAPGARLALDGGPSVPSPLIREVEPGNHEVEVSAEGFFPEKRGLSAVAGELIPVIVTLRERVSTVAVSTPTDAEVYVDGSFAGRGGARMTLELPSGIHHLTVARNGYRVASRTLEVERGKSRSIDVQLVPTRQRMASRALFMASGAALVTGVVFAALAVSAEKTAQDLLDRRLHQNITSDERTRYDEAVTRRGRWRAVAGGSLAVMTGCLVTGLLLYQFDQPSSESFYRPAGGPGSPPPPGTRQTAWSRLRLGVAPLAGAGRLGAVVSTVF